MLVHEASVLVVVSSAMRLLPPSRASATTVPVPQAGASVMSETSGRQAKRTGA